MPPEHDDVARRARFERAFGLVYEPLQRYVRRRIGASEVDDVVAETLLAFWRRLDDVAEADELGWCYGAARRCLANTRRSGDRRDRLAVRVAGETAAASTGPPDPDPELSSAFTELSADDRELVRLWAWEQLAPREIAVVLGITANAASIRLHRAKQRLARRLGKNDDSAGHKPLEDLTGPREEGA